MSSRARSRARRSSGPRSRSWKGSCGRSIPISISRPRSSGSKTSSIRYLLFRMLLEPLEGVKQSPKYHPEGDALYHSLQVFELAREERPYDEEFLLAALLHDVGKAIDPSDHVAAALQSLEGFDHPTHRVADRAPHGGPGPARGHARREGPCADPGVGVL